MDATQEHLIENLQREVQRKFGRCMFRLQQYELLAKSLASRYEVSTSGSHVKRAEKIATKSLGSVIGELTDSCLSTAKPEGDFAVDHKIEGDELVWARTRISIVFSAEDYDRVKRELKELVDLRNDLAHHFIERFDVWSQDGCLAADGYLQECFAKIDLHFAQLREWVQSLEHAMAEVASFLESPAGLRLLSGRDE